MGRHTCFRLCLCAFPKIVSWAQPPEITVFIRIEKGYMFPQAQEVIRNDWCFDCGAPLPGSQSPSGEQELDMLRTGVRLYGIKR